MGVECSSKNKLQVYTEDDNSWGGVQVLFLFLYPDPAGSRVPRRQ